MENQALATRLVSRMAPTGQKLWSLETRLVPEKPSIEPKAFQSRSDLVHLCRSQERPILWCACCLERISRDCGPRSILRKIQNSCSWLNCGHVRFSANSTHAVFIVRQCVDSSDFNASIAASRDSYRFQSLRDFRRSGGSEKFASSVSRIERISRQAISEF